MLLVLLALACGDDAEPPRAPTEPPRTPETPEAPARDPLEGLDEPAEPSEIAPDPTGELPGPATLEAATPERGCVALTRAPLPVWPRPGPATVVAQGQSFVLAGYAPGEGGGEEVFLVRVSPEAAPRPLRTLALDPPSSGGRLAAPGLAPAGAHHVTLAVVDGRGRVRVTDVATDDLRAELPLHPVGAGADPRFAPAVAARERHRLVAWTDGSGTPMRVKLAVVALDGTVSATHDVTPPAMGASAPSFAAGVSPPELYFFDARAGVSPIVRVAVGADGEPAAPAVARSVGTVGTPPRVAVARSGSGLWAGFTVIGNAATTAVGFLRLDEGDAPPAALVPGTGYGRLHVDAAAAPRAALFAADAPKDAPPESPREVHVRLVDAQGAGPALTLEGPDGTAAHASIARRADGLVAVALTSGAGVHVAWLRCDDD